MDRRIIALLGFLFLVVGTAYGMMLPILTGNGTIGGGGSEGTYTVRTPATSALSDTCNKPTGTASGDLLTALVIIYNDPTLTGPSGLSLIHI